MAEQVTPSLQTEKKSKPVPEKLSAEASQPVNGHSSSEHLVKQNGEVNNIDETTSAAMKIPVSETAVSPDIEPELAICPMMPATDTPVSPTTEEPITAGSGVRQRTSISSDNQDENENTTRTSFVSVRKSRKYDDPPIVFQDVNGIEALNKLNNAVGSQLGEDEKLSLKDLQEYLSTDGGAWALGSNHLDAIGRLLNDKNFQLEIPLTTLHLLQAAALKEDVILLLHQDRKDHHLMSYIYRIETLPFEEQEEIAKLMCNFCFHPNTFDWLMYISEWQESGYPCNNNKVTIRVAVHALLSDPPSLQEKGAALMYNLALKELFDDTATELATAVLQYLHGDLKEEPAYWCLTALLRFLYISYNDVPALIKMLGPDLKKFSKKSARIDEVLEQILFKLNVSVSA